MFLIRKVRGITVGREVEAAARLYATPLPVERIRAWQLDRLRCEWRRITAEVPYFAKLRQEGRVPHRIENWEHFFDAVPASDRSCLRVYRDGLRSREHRPRGYRSTGGSTGEPVTLPVWNSEIRRARTNLWLGRSWFGVRPSDRLFLLWGHSHLFGRGARGWARRLARVASDRLLGYRRCSAYDLSEPAMRRAGADLLRFRPDYVLGYAVALDRFARANSDRRDDFRRLRLKAAFATAESFPSAGSAAFLHEVLGCPVAMEYGAVETGPIAHQQPGSNYAVFWRDYLLEGVPSPHVPGAFELLVTSLYPRCLPLVRYRIGDLVSCDPRSDPRRIERVIGRCNDAVELPSGTVVHSEAFTHAVRDVDGIAGFQVAQSPRGDVCIEYVAAEPIGEAARAEIRERLGRIDSELNRVDIRRVRGLSQTIAGKTRRVRGGPPPAGGGCAGKADGAGG